MTASDSSARPALARDPWAWVCALAPIALFIGTRGAARGEAVAEDFDFLRRALLERSNSWLDGGGSLSFWRPIAQQLYYKALGTTILEHPLAVSMLHGVLLAIATLLLYGLLRRHWSGPLAAAAATFVLFSESTRTLICWPSHSADLGVFLFSMLALSEAAARRMPTALAALAAALLCKEIAVVTALMLPFLPDPAQGSRRARLRWMLGAGLVVATWAAAYDAVRRHSGLELPHGLESDLGTLSTGLVSRLGWALWNSKRALFSLSLRAGPLDWIFIASGLLAASLIAIALVRDPAARARVRDIRGWLLWGGAWFMLGTAALTTIFPLWSPYRSQFAGTGFGIAAVGLAGAVHPALAGALVGSRLVLFALAPGVPARITPEPEDRGAFIDLPRLARLQHMMRSARQALAAHSPTLPHGAVVVLHNLPHATEYAFGGSHAVQVWYRDTTLRCVPFDSLKSNPALNVAALISYQPHHDPQIVILDPSAVRHQLAGLDALWKSDWPLAVREFDRADSLQRDRRALVFRADNAGRRAFAYAALNRIEPAEADARFTLAIAPDDVGARYVLAFTMAKRGERGAALAQLDTVLARAPGNAEALALRAQLSR